VYSKGYEQMTVQDILDGLQLSKGAFYHYFSSKPALLEALIERMLGDAEQILIPIVNDPRLPALEKLQRFFATAARWKTARKGFLLALLRVWYTDDNAVVRQKVLAAGYKRVTPLLTAIIRQGVQEGVLATPYPDRVGEVTMSLMQGLGDSFAEMLLSYEPNHDAAQRIESCVAAYTDALERVLGAPTGSLTLVDSETMREWLVSGDATQNGVG
jgi:AcrR family transcriptional regulator